ncbi:MAG: tRNA (guanosine(46)-N7)-methyltransferase TrmB [Calditrichaeota bacterium]|nr:MAG: tRNA (guanosine(46)-N7)-methyltransferase TrmB [Calditrichota bacterium]
MERKTFYLQYEIFPARFDRYPLDWDALFGRTAPLAVEIGFGNGEFLVEWARQQPEWNFVGIEISAESMKRLQKRLHQEGCSNILPIRENARFALRELFPDNRIRKVMMNFPDPWPKTHHESRRLLNPDFVHTLAAVLEIEGEYELITDQEWYAGQARELFEANSCFQVEEIEQNPRRPVTTKYERKWRAMGRNTYRLLARKRRGASLTRLLEDATMPHAFVTRPVQAEDIRQLAGLEYFEKDRLFVVKGTFTQLDRENFLIRVVAKDGDYHQNFYVLVKPHEDGRWLVKLDSTTLPYRTPAVKMAVWKIGELLEQGST